MRKHGMGRITGLVREQGGQDTIEYALGAALIGIGAIACLKGLSSTYNGLVSLGASFLTWIT